MKIAILGAGNVGTAVTERALRSGIEVVIGRRDPGDREGVPDGAEVASLADAPRGAEFVLLAVPAAAALELAPELELDEGAILVDCTNPVRWDDGPIWNPPSAGSVTAALSAARSDLRVVKALNHFGAEIHRRPELGAGSADALVAGADPEVRSRVLELVERLGFRGRDAGPLRNAALLENLAVLWIHLALSGGLGRSWAFRIEGLD